MSVERDSNIIEGVSDGNAKRLVLGCLSVPVIAVIVGLIYVLSWLQSCGSPPPPTPQQVAERERAEQREAQEAREFEGQQGPLWLKSANDMSEEDVTAEIVKCQTDIKKSDGSPYAWSFSSPTPSEMLTSIKSFGYVRLVSKNRKDAPINNNVEVASYDCQFKGAGFERFQKDYNTSYKSSYGGY